MARWCVSPSARKTGTNPPERNARATSLRREALGSRALAAWLAAAAMLSPGEGAAATPPGLAGAQTDAEAELERALEGAATLRGDAYLRARDLLVQRHATRLPARVAAARWSAASWRSDAAAALALAAYQRSAPDPHEEVPPGLDPRHYLAARRPEPTALRDLKAWVGQGRLDALGWLEWTWKTVELTPLSAINKSVGEVSPGAGSVAPQGLADEERAALWDGLLMVSSLLRHPAISHVLAEVAATAAVPARHRSVAAAALGATGDPAAESLLLRLQAALGKDADERVAEGAMVGLGRLGTVGAVTHLGAVARDADDTSARVTAMSALGRAGSTFAHAQRPEGERESRRQLASDALVRALRSARADAEVQAAIEALCVVRHPSALQRVATEGGAGDADPRWSRAEARLRQALARDARARAGQPR